MADATTLLVLLLIGALTYWIDVHKRKRLRSLPPGPKALPIVGNIFDIPKEKPWLAYQDWADKYDSNILFMDLPRRPTIIINSFDDAVELMERRSKLYSDRPQDFMDTLTGWSWNMGFHPYGQRWRDTRRNFHQHFHQFAVSKYHPIQTREVRLLLKRALDFSEKVDIKSLSLTFASIILEAAYGISINSLDDELALLSQTAIEALNLSKNIGEYWVEFYPWLWHIPIWGPGARARKAARYYHPIVESTRNTPFEAVSKAIDEGTATPSVLQQLLLKLRDENGSAPTDALEYQNKIQAAKDAAGIAYAAAVDTQTSALCWFLAAMSVAPEVQRKAQAELDAKLGSRLPTMDDLPSFPYVQAILLETMRLCTVTPMSVAHRLLDGADDEFRGYIIPAGSTIIPNVWAMLHDPVEYPDPDQFRPERFLVNGRLNPNVRDPLLAAFGFGRRICPGRYLAMDTLTLSFASLLSVFDVESTLPEGQRELPEPTTTLISYPVDVPCRLKPRTAVCVSLINTEAQIAAANKPLTG